MADRADITIIGGGLAGSEAAWQAAERGLRVDLFEMRPTQMTGAHTTGLLAELVCSNSLGSALVDRAPGLLKEELRRMGSLLIECADASAVPAGRALAVDRELFAQMVTQRVEKHPKSRLLRQEVTEIPTGFTIIASGPLTSPAFSAAIARLIGAEYLYFYDAIAPIVAAESINLEVAYQAARYDPINAAPGDYLNCPLDQTEYMRFLEALLQAERIDLYEFKSEIERGVQAGAGHFFEGCLPLEILAQRDPLALAYGPLRPVGLINPRTGRWPYAVVQLRQDNLAGSLFNLVGFQTNLKFSEQQRVFRMIPGLEQAEFTRYGQMHRNTFIFSPGHLRPTMQFRGRDDLFFAGQITGVEGYAGNIATGLLAGWNAARLLLGQPLVELPVTTMIGGLCHYVTHASAADFQPMKANFGLLPPFAGEQAIRDKWKRYQAYAQRSLGDLTTLLTGTK